MDMSGSKHYRPTVSLLVAMRNEENYIRQCLDSILRQDYPVEKIEVLVVDGESTDRSCEIVEEYSQKHNHIKLYHNPKRIQSAAWNIGIKESNGEVLTIVSAHSILSNDYISNATETLFRTGADLVGGPMNAIGQGIIAETISIATSQPFGIGGGKFHYASKEEFVDTVYMGFCRRSLYEKVGGFDEEMVRNQDDELSYRILDHNGVILCNPAIQSYYYNRATYKSLWKQYYQYGFYKVRVLQKHPKQIRMRQYIPPLFVISIVLSGLLAIINRVSLYIFMAIVGSYILANITASILTAVRSGWRFLIRLPFIFAILHISYGMGFLVGLMKFRDLWGGKHGATQPIQNNSRIGEIQ